MFHLRHPRIDERQEHGVHLTAHETIGLNGRLAVLITHSFGTMAAFYVLVAWMLIWMGLASVGFWLFKLDPYPFAFLLFLSNLIQLWALPILAVGQQVLSRASDKQALQTFKDAEAILHLSDEVHRLIKINNQLTEEIHALVSPQKLT